MGIVLGPSQYGKAETRVVRVYRDNSIEDYALALARHFVTDVAPVTGARVEVEEYRWERVSVDGQPHPHTFARASGEVRTTAVTVTGQKDALQSWVVSGLDGLVVMKSAGSEFAGFLKDRYTTLAETTDRILATSLTARWRYEPRRHRTESWDEAHAEIRQVLLERFAGVHSLALQQTLWEMGKAVLEARDDVAEVRLSAPNRHHFLVDLAPFGLDNPGEGSRARLGLRRRVRRVAPNGPPTAPPGRAVRT